MKINKVYLLYSFFKNQCSYSSFKEIIKFLDVKIILSA